MRSRTVGPALYEVKWQVMISRAHGLPQKRKRLYISGLRRQLQQTAFLLPAPLPAVSMHTILEDDKIKYPAAMPPSTIELRNLDGI